MEETRKQKTGRRPKEDPATITQIIPIPKTRFEYAVTGALFNTGTITATPVLVGNTVHPVTIFISDDLLIMTLDASYVGTTYKFTTDGSAPFRYLVAAPSLGTRRSRTIK